MKRTGLVASCLPVSAPPPGAYECSLPFSPNPGYRVWWRRDIVSTRTTMLSAIAATTRCPATPAPAREAVGHAPVNESYLRTCKWDLYGNLLSVTQGAPAIPSPVSTDGTKLIFAINANGQSTGVDAKNTGHGFVRTAGDARTMLQPVVNAVWSIDKDQRVYGHRNDGECASGVDRPASL